MGGSTVWPRTGPQGAPALHMTRDGGNSRQRRGAGLPASQAWWTVMRQALTGNAQDRLRAWYVDQSCVDIDATRITSAPRAQGNFSRTRSRYSPSVTISPLPAITHPWPGLRVPCTLREAAIS